MLEKLTLKEQNAISQLAKTVGTVMMVIVYGSRLYKLKTNDIDVIFVCGSIPDPAKINTANNKILATSGVKIHPIITEKYRCFQEILKQRFAHGSLTPGTAHRFFLWPAQESFSGWRS